MRRRPSQKLGIDTPSRATAIEPTSSHEFRPSAATRPRGTPERHGDEHGGESELGGAADVLRDLGRHRPAASDGGAEVAAEGVADEAPVLHEDRLVEVKLSTHASDLIGIGHELREHHLDGVAGDEEQHAEHGERDPEEHRHHREQAPRDPGQHGEPSLMPRLYDDYLRRMTSLKTGYALKLYLVPCTLARKAHTERSSTRGTVSASSSTSFSMAR